MPSPRVFIAVVFGAAGAAAVGGCFVPNVELNGKECDLAHSCDVGYACVDVDSKGNGICQLEDGGK